MPATHTPGPWTYDPDTGEITAVIAEGEMLLAIVPLEGSRQIAQAHVDGALKAAAPDLLAALQGFMRSDCSIPEADMYESARAAIAKATAQ